MTEEQKKAMAEKLVRQMESARRRRGSRRTRPFGATPRRRGGKVDEGEAPESAPADPGAEDLVGGDLAREFRSTLERLDGIIGPLPMPNPKHALRRLFLEYTSYSAPIVDDLYLHYRGLAAKE